MIIRKISLLHFFLSACGYFVFLPICGALHVLFGSPVCCGVGLCLAAWPENQTENALPLWCSILPASSQVLPVSIPSHKEFERVRFVVIIQCN